MSDGSLDGEGGEVKAEGEGCWINVDGFFRCVLRCYGSKQRSSADDRRRHASAKHNKDLNTSQRLQREKYGREADEKGAAFRSLTTIGGRTLSTSWPKLGSLTLRDRTTSTSVILTSKPSTMRDNRRNFKTTTSSISGCMLTPLSSGAWLQCIAWIVCRE